MSHGKSIRIFLRDGSVTGIRHAELYNWTGQAIACPRKRLKELKDWYDTDNFPGTQSTGVYFLFGQRDGAPTVYIGESENTLERIGQHLPTKDFWNEVVIFTNKDQNLTKAHVQYLEAKLIRRAHETNRFQLDNGNTPTGASLAPAERAPMDEFVDNMRFLLGALGYRLLEPVAEQTNAGQRTRLQSTSLSDDDGGEVTNNLDTVFSFQTGNASATAELTDEGFLIHEGSTASKTETESLHDTYIQTRRELVDSGQLEDDGDVLRFTENVLCTSPSSAASIIAGSVRSGPREWQDSHGNSLREREEEVKSALTGDLDDAETPDQVPATH